ncbi:MAG: hypothetical protein PHN78_05390 [Dehalococcoidales bacterium]|nr:hypothetical protein [Dehalococcoidales bacterium]
MKKISLKHLPILIIVSLVSLIASSCHSPIVLTPASNNDVISYKEFYLSAENVSLSTKVRGTIYIKGDMEKTEDRRVQISAWMEIDSNDWGGIGFSFPQGWEITGITSDYPQGNPKPESYIGTMSRAPGDEIVTYINIGNTKYGAPDVKGGKGSIIIELAPEEKKPELPENFHVVIGIGSKYDYILHPIYETYEVPMSTDYHNVSPYTIHPSPGNYITGSDFNKSKVALKDVRTETVTADADYFNPWHQEAAIKKGETCLIVTGHVQNMDEENLEIAMWAEGNDTYGNIVSWTLDAAHIAGQIGLHLEYMEVGEFAMHLNLPKDMITVRIYAASYPVTPP